VLFDGSRIPTCLDTIAWCDKNSVAPWCAGEVRNCTGIVREHQRSYLLKIVIGAGSSSCALEDVTPYSVSNTILFPMISVGFPSQVDIAVTTRKKQEAIIIYSSLKRYRSKFCVILTRELVDQCFKRAFYAVTTREGQDGIIISRSFRRYRSKCCVILPFMCVLGNLLINVLKKHFTRHSKDLASQGDC
jgi:hypothetical protein